MKNAINYYYNLMPEDIHQLKNKYVFKANEYYYIMQECFLNLEEIYELYNLEYYLYGKEIYLHQFILNTSNEIITNINNKNYVLLRKIINNQNKIKKEDLIIFLNTNIIYKYPNIIKNDWRTLWINKIDYIEYQTETNKNKYKILTNNIDYFIGIIETGIQLLSETDLNYNLYLSHRRINTNNKVEDLYNPLNIVIDSKVRDLSEYYKDAFYKGLINIDDIVNDFKKSNLTSLEKRLFFIRMLFPSFFLDLYDSIITDSLPESKFDIILNKIRDYELLLKLLNEYLYKNNIIPEIEWLKKM